MQKVVTIPRDADPLKRELRNGEKERQVHHELERILWQHSERKGALPIGSTEGKADHRLHPVEWNPVKFFGGRYMQRNPHKRHEISRLDDDIAGVRPSIDKGKRCWKFPPGAIPRTLPLP